AVSVAIATILTWPSGRPAIASRAASLPSACITSAPPSAFGSMTASGAAGTTASRSASARPVTKPLMRTMRRGRGLEATMPRTKSAALMRAADLPSAGIESSRSTITASAPLAIALSSFLPPSAGTNSSERINRVPMRSAPRRLRDAWRSPRPHAHEDLAAAFGHQLVVLVVGAVVELDDAGARTRVRFALADDFGGAMDGIAFEQRVGELHLCHAEIGDGGADGEVVDHDPDHQAEREQRVHQRLAPFGLLLAEMPVDVQRLRIEQHVVHLRHRARERVLVEVPDHEIVEIEAPALVADRGRFGHLRSSCKTR